MAASISDSSKDNYLRSLAHYQNFCNQYQIPGYLPVSAENLLRFVSFMYMRGYAAASIQLAVSAIAFVHKLNGFDDPSNNILVKKSLVGIKNVSTSKVQSRPLPRELLDEIIQKAEGILPDSFTNCLFQSMVSLGFYALLRVGEMTRSHNCLQLDDILAMESSLQITFRTYKHSKGQAATIQVKSRSPSTSCPVYLLHQYLHLRGKKAGALFLKEDGKIPSRLEFWEWLQTVIKACGVPPNVYNTHSLRKGGATNMARSGHTEEQIRLYGRWKSSAYKQYIRLNNF